MGEKLQIPDITEKALNPTELITAVKKKLSHKSSGQWLLIIDNVDIFDVLKKDTDEGTVTGSLSLLDCRPQSLQGSIIFTTRNRKAAIDLAGKNIVEVGAMDLGQAKDLLEKWVFPKTLLGEDEAVINKLLELLTRLPLAIIQAGAYMAREYATVSKYVEFYEESKQEALDLLSKKVSDEGGIKSNQDPVAITWRISFDQIRGRDELAAEYLSSMACLFHQNIPKSLLPTCPSKRKAKEAIATLMAYSFVTERNPDGHYDMHPLVHLVTQDWLKENLLKE